jgi:DNA-binding NtrC family response regulator
MLTGHADAEMVVKARDAGVHDFIVKPASARQIEDRITRIVTAQRPFVEAPAFIGPDRRTRQGRFSGPDRRRGGSSD